MDNLEKLGILIDEFGQSKANYDELKKLVDKRNKDIKELMKELNLDNYATDDWVVTKSVSERETLNEDKLLDVIKEFDPNNVYGMVKSKEYVDMNELEKSLYHAVIPGDTILKMDSCRDIKEVVTLRIGRPKKEKVDE